MTTTNQTIQTLESIVGNTKSGLDAALGDTRKALSYDERMEYACDVCSNVPDEDGCIEHGKGCYTQSEDGGGYSYVDFDDNEFVPANCEVE